MQQANLLTRLHPFINRLWQNIVEQQPYCAQKSWIRNWARVEAQVLRTEKAQQQGNSHQEQDDKPAQDSSNDPYPRSARNYMSQIMRKPGLRDVWPGKTQTRLLN